jgi:hypothetical protein
MGRDWRSCVEKGSKGVAPGVIKAFKFWLIVSSTAVRDTRRKSMVLAHERKSAHYGFMRYLNRLPLSAVWLKQNCGVSPGCSGVRDIILR